MSVNPWNIKEVNCSDGSSVRYSNRNSRYYKYQMFCSFIGQIKSGKKSIIIGTDYVVISREHYDELIKRRRTK